MKTYPRVLSLLVPVAIALAAACSRFEASPNDGVNGDGGLDGATVNETGSNNNSDGSGGSDAGCQGTFCDDFERVDVKGDWDTQTPVTTGVMAVVPNASASRVLSITTPPGGPALFLDKVFPIAKKHISVSFDINLAKSGSDGEVDLVQLRWVSPPSPCTVLGLYLVRAASGSLILQETYTNCSSLVSTPLAFGGGWQRVVLDLDISQDGILPSHVTVSIDGAGVFAQNVRAFPSGAPKLRIGFVDVRKTLTDWAVFYDNVKVDIDP